MIVKFETFGKVLAKIDLNHVPAKGEAVTIFDTVYEVINVGYSTTIKTTHSGKYSVKQIGICEVKPIVIGHFQEDKWIFEGIKSAYCNQNKI